MTSTVETAQTRAPPAPSPNASSPPSSRHGRPRRLPRRPRLGWYRALADRCGADVAELSRAAPAPSATPGSGSSSRPSPAADRDRPARPRAPLHAAGGTRRGADRRDSLSYVRRSRGSSPRRACSCPPSPRRTAPVAASAGRTSALIGGRRRPPPTGRVPRARSGSDWLPAVPDVARRLLRRRRAGRRHRLRRGLVGHRRWPRLTRVPRVDGFDMDAAVDRDGHGNAVETGVGDRVRFHRARRRERRRRDATTSSSPSSACTTCPTRSRCSARCGALAAEGGTVIVMDERVAESSPRPATTWSGCSTAHPDVLPARRHVARSSRSPPAP